jgi:hypothetical protein
LVGIGNARCAEYRSLVTDLIYVVGNGGVLSPAARTPYRLEDDLQQLIADHPELLPGDQIDPVNPRRWRLIRREAGVGPSRDSARWSVDHLFVDQDATPTLVEAKRGGNPEARREVVAQLLEYAANGTLYWPVEQLRSWFEERFSGHDAAVTSITELLQGNDGADGEGAYQGFWDLVGNNLRDRHVRLIFVADEIPGELKTLVEFLNEEMTHLEVLAVEVVLYAGNGQQLLVPRLVGQTSKAMAAKEATKHAASRDKPWTEDEILDLLGAGSDVAREMGEAIVEWAHRRGDLEVQGNRGLTYPMLHFRLPLPNGPVTVCSMYSVPKYLFEIPFGILRSRPPFTDSSSRASLHRALLPLTRMAKGDPESEQYVYASIGTLEGLDQLRELLAIVDSYIDSIKATAKPTA